MRPLSGLSTEHQADVCQGWDRCACTQRPWHGVELLLLAPLLCTAHHPTPLRDETTVLALNSLGKVLKANMATMLTLPVLLLTRYPPLKINMHPPPPHEIIVSTHLISRLPTASAPACQ
jgi:hypothetical protein